MFKQEDNYLTITNYLYVKPGEAIWSIEYELNKGDIELSGGLANQTCPAHPSSLIDQKGNATNWETEDGVKGVLLRCATHDPANAKWLVEQGRAGHISKEKVGAYLCQEDQDGSCLLSVLDLNVQQEVANWNPDTTEKIACTLSLEFVQWLVEQAREGNWDKKSVGSILCRENKERAVILRLFPFEVQKEVATWYPDAADKVAHMLGFEFAQWLVEQAREGRWDRTTVGSILCRENKERTIILGQFNFEVQKEVAYWNRERTNEAAHLVGFDFVNWLIGLALEGTWDKEEVGNIVFRRNMHDQLILATLDKETQKAVAVFNKSKTSSALPCMEKEFLHWLYQEAVEGRWEKQMVFKALLVKEEADGELIITTSKKKGTVLICHIGNSSLTLFN